MIPTGISSFQFRRTLLQTSAIMKGVSAQGHLYRLIGLPWTPFANATVGEHCDQRWQGSQT